MESILYHSLLNIVYSFLDKKSLVTYDSANTNIKNREIMLYTFQNYYDYKISTCRWSILKGFKFVYQTCKVKYIDYVSPICKNLIIHKQGCINIKNDNITTLYIDMHANGCRIRNIICKNLKNLTIVLAERNLIDLDIFKYLDCNCPKIEKIILINCDISFDITKLVKNNVKIKII